MTSRQAARAPSATYRLQLSSGFTLRDARALAGYLDRLGVSDVYLSPVFSARPGSAHGYDIVDPTSVRAELGGRHALDGLAGELRRRGMGLLLDIVPNHMAIARENSWWQDVLRRSERSRYAGYFDIDWSRSRGNDLSYRRFFDVDHLVGMRVEDADVFEATHALILDLVRSGVASGLRIDHIDGLLDPLGYLRALRRRAGRETYLVVEKILTGGEPLPDGWPVAGTTGYDFLNTINGLFIDPGGLAELDAAYRKLTGERAALSNVTYDAKRHVLRRLFAREMETLADELSELAARDAPELDLARDEARDAIEEVTAGLGVYRTYSRTTVSDADRRVIQRALRAARARNNLVRDAVFSFLRRVLLLRAPRGRGRAWRHFVLRWQQYTGPATAKGFEDTALYRYHRLISLNEVGADPEGAGALDIDAFHTRMRERLARMPDTMSATATHDTKRGEDARTRISVLSELAGEWSRLAARWRRVNRPLRARVGRRLAPDAVEEALIYQALIGAWPLGAEEVPGFRERFDAYLIKALREGKRNTSWREQDLEYEEAVLSFARGLFEDEAFLSGFVPFQRRVALHGAANSLAQVLIKTAAPGLPDVYQGTELWDLSLVDPDNRRPVDFVQRARRLDELDRAAARDRAALARSLLRRWEDGTIKLYVTAQALRHRRANARLFARGSYQPLRASGAARGHVVAFARRSGARWALIAGARLSAGIAPRSFPIGTDVWGDDVLRLPAGAPSRWRDVFTGVEIGSAGRTLALRELFGVLPVALLEPAG